MCGRYVSARRRRELLDTFEVERDATQEELPPDYNVAPTKPVYAVLTRDHDGAKVRQLRVVRWGLVPSWAANPAIGSRLINARAETVAEKPAFRRAFARRRCLLPADGYYEWYTLDGDGRAARRPRKQPFFIRPEDGGVLAMAGLYEAWRDPTRPEDDPQAWLVTCAVITTRAQDALGRIHDRMPVIVEPAHWADWLDPARAAPDDLRGLLTLPQPGRLVADPVSTAVNDVRNNGPELLRPLPPTGPGRDDSGTLF